jgi:hypothetical protein
MQPNPGRRTYTERLKRAGTLGGDIIGILGVVSVIARLLTPQEAHLMLSIDPPDATVTVNGLVAANEQLKDLRIAPGEVSVAVGRPGYLSSDTVLSLGTGETQVITIALRPLVKAGGAPLPAPGTNPPTPTAEFTATSPESAADRISEVLGQVPAPRYNRLHVEPLMIGETGTGSSFSLFMKDLLERRMSSTGAWHVLIDEAGGSPDEPTHSLVGKYWLRSGVIVVSARLVESGSHRLLGSVEVRLARSGIRRASSASPPANLNTALADLKVLGTAENVDGELKLDVTTNKGKENLIFVEGDTMRVRVLVNLPCHLRVLYHMANGRRVLLMEGIKIPAQLTNRQYELPKLLECSPPFGVEILQVIARTEPFPPVQTETADGYDYLKDDINAFAAASRGMKVKPDRTLQAEQRLVITSVAKAATPLPPEAQSPTN